MQYAPVALVLWLAKIISLKPNPAWLMFGGSLIAVTLVGVLEWFSWGGFFHSYQTNISANFLLNETREAQPIDFYLPRLLYATLGGILLAVWACVRQPRKYLLIWACMLILLAFHSLLADHKEFRFVFLLLVLGLIPLAGWFSSLAKRYGNLFNIKIPVGIASLFCLLVLANILPYEKWLHKADIGERGNINYLRGQTNMFALYLKLSELDNVKGVMHIPDAYYTSPLYYYLHHKVPYYTFYSAQDIQKLYDLDITQLVSHVVSKAEIGDPRYTVLSHEGEYKLYEIEVPDGTQITSWHTYKPLDMNGVRFMHWLFDDKRPVPEPGIDIDYK